MEPLTVIFTQAIRHNGIILAFYVMEDQDQKISLNYRIFDPEPGLPSQIDTWDDLNELDLGYDYRLVGSSVMDSFNNDEDGSVEFYPYLNVISEKGQIYLFRHIKNNGSSNKESITVNRLRLFHQTLPMELDENPDAKQTDDSSVSNPEIQVVQQLERIWEPRFRNSESRTVPNDDNDTMDYKNTLGQPFYEPTLILDHLPAAKHGYFTTDIFTTDNPDQGLWHFYINQKVKKDEHGNDAPHDELHIFYVKQSQDGLFDFPTPNIIAESTLKPDNEIYFKVERNSEYKQSCLKFGVTCQRYAYQEVIPKILEPNEAENKHVKRQLRQFISFGANSVDHPGTDMLVFFDFAVQGNGKLAPMVEDQYAQHLLSPNKKPINLQKVGPDTDPQKSNFTASPINDGRSISELTIMAGYFYNNQQDQSGASLNNNVTPTSLPFIQDGSDGLLHIYFKNNEDYFSAIQYDAKARRLEIAFRLSENSNAKGDDVVTTQKGELLFIMRQPGEFEKEKESYIKFCFSGDQDFKNEEAINWEDRELKNDTIKGLYSCYLRDLKGDAQYWRGIPRRLPNLADTINGKASSSPRDDQYFLSGEKTYFDGNQERLQLFVPEHIDNDADATSRRTIMLSPKAPRDDISLGETQAVISLPDMDLNSFDTCNPYLTGTLVLKLCLSPWLKVPQLKNENPDYIGVEIDPHDQLVWTYGKYLYRNIEGTDEINEVKIADDYKAQCMAMSQGRDGTCWVGANSDSGAALLKQFNFDAQYGKTLITSDDITAIPSAVANILALVFDPRRQVLWVSGIHTTKGAQLYKYNPRTKKIDDDYSEFGFSDIQAMTCDENGALCIIGTETENSQGIVAKIFDSAECQSKGINLTAGPMTSNAMCSSSPGVFFTGTSEGVYCFDFSKSTDTPNNPYKLTVSDDTGVQASALRYDKKRDIIWITGITGENNDAEGHLYLATRESGGDGKYTIQSVEKYMNDDTVTNPIENTAPLALALTQEGTPWVMTADATEVNRFRVKKDIHGAFKETWNNIPLGAKEFTKILLGRGSDPGELSRPYDYATNSSITRVNNADVDVSMNGLFGIITDDDTSRGLLQGSLLYSVLPIDAEDLLQPGTYKDGQGSYRSSCPYTSYGPSRDYSVHMGQISEDAYDTDLTSVQELPGETLGPVVILHEEPGEAPKFLAAPSDLNSYSISTHNNCISAKVEDDAFPVTDDLTMEMWVKPTTTSNSFANLVSRCSHQMDDIENITFGIKPSALSLGFGMTEIKDQGTDTFIDYILLPSFGLPPSFTIEFWARMEAKSVDDVKRTFLSLSSVSKDSVLFCVNWEHGNTLRIIINDKIKDFKFSGINSHNDLDQKNIRYRIKVVPEENGKYASITPTLFIDKVGEFTADPRVIDDFKTGSYLGINTYTESGKDSSDDEGFVWCIGQDYHHKKLDDNFIGYMQELRIWAGSINDPDPFQYASDLLSGDEANLIAYYPLSDGPGARFIHDASSNRYHGLPQSAKKISETDIEFYSKAQGFIWLTEAILNREGYGLFAGSNEASGMVQSIAKYLPFDSWSHISAICRMSYALTFQGSKDNKSSYINFGHHSSLNPESGLTIAATIEYTPKSSDVCRKVLLSKIGQKPEDRSYEFYLTEDDHLGVTVYIDLAPNTPYYAINLESTEPIKTKQIVEIAASFTIHSDIDTNIEGNQAGVNSIVNWDLELYQNGNSIAKLTSSKTLSGVVTPKIKTSGADLVFGRYYNPNAESPECEFIGDLLELSLWKRGLSKIEIRNLAIFNQSHNDGMISHWPINEGSGDTVHDDFSNNHGTVICNDSSKINSLWRNEPSKANWKILVNGKAVKTSRMNSDHAYLVCKNSDTSDSHKNQPWGEQNYSLHCGKRIDKGGDGEKYTYFMGSIDELRLWSTARTAEQIYTYAQRPLNTNTIPEHLILYWNFNGKEKSKGIEWNTDNNSWSIHNWASEIGLLTGRVAGLGEDEFNLAFVSSSPSSPESPLCVMAFGNIKKPNYDIPKLNTRPMVYEYGDLVLHDDYSISKGLMKRGYLAPTSDTPLGEETNVVVGELDVIYVGQAQMNPTLIGFIEGPPPLPSENLTIMQPPKPDDYTGTASIELSESKDVDYSFSASRDTGFTLDLDAQLGLIFKDRGEIQEGGLMGTPAFSTDVYDIEALTGLKMSLSHKLFESQSAARNAGLHMGHSTYLENVGGYEDVTNDGEVAVPYLGRRFLPSNIGSALVKSATGNLYGLRLKDTGALVSYELVPNPDIPVDWNIIIFPINSDYTKNGTLDGMVGFTPDPDYPEAYGGNLGSYFKPKEAYRMKREIERETKQFESIYAQQKVNQGGDPQKSLPSDQKLGYDFDTSLAKKSLVNTYVWTADGGLFSEEEQYHTSKSESFGGGYSLSGKAGVYASIKSSAKGIWGVDIGFDLMFGAYLNVNTTKSQNSSVAFGIKAKVVGEGFINQRDDDVNGNGNGLYPYNSKLQPGKVRGYRFLSYYLSPKPEHFEDFYNTVVDSEWLRFSNDPDAAALRQAMPHSVGVWRMLHRVTYVSRVLPDINDTKFWTKVLPSKEIWYPDSTSVAENDWVIYAVENTTKPTVSPYNPDLITIGKAVDNLINTTFNGNLPISLSDDKKEVLRARMVFFLQRYYGIIPEKLTRKNF